MITFPYISTTTSFRIHFISFCTRIIQHMSLWFNQIWPFGNKSSRKDINRKLILFHSIKPVYFQFVCYYIKGEYYILSQSFKWRSCIPRRRKIWFWHFTRWEFQFIYKHCAYTWYLLFTINDEDEEEWRRWGMHLDWNCDKWINSELIYQYQSISLFDPIHWTWYYYKVTGSD